MDPTAADTAPSPAELPPVEPPSARFIVQLFLIPFAIVMVLVTLLSLVYLGFGRLATGGADASEYVRAIRAGNENQRWRAATDLATLINNDPKLARDPTLLGELADLLAAELPGSGRDARVAQYLALTLGAFQTLDARPVGGRTADPLGTLARALGPDLPAEVRVAAAISLSRQADRLGGTLDDPRVVPALVQAASADVAEIRQHAAYALGYFADPAAVTALRRAVEDDERLVRYNAAAALARQGDPAARPILQEMLSPPDLAQVIRLDGEGETHRQIEAIELEALWALKAAVKAGKFDLAEALRPDLDALRRTGPPTIQVEAADLLKSLPTPP